VVDGIADEYRMLTSAHHLAEVYSVLTTQLR